MKIKGILLTALFWIAVLTVIASAVETEHIIKPEATSGITVEQDPHWTRNFSNMQNDCPAGQYAYGVTTNGSLKCRADTTGNATGNGSKWAINEDWLVNDSDTLDFNGTKLNNTINYLALLHNATQWVVAQGYIADYYNATTVCDGLEALTGNGKCINLTSINGSSGGGSDSSNWTLWNWIASNAIAPIANFNVLPNGTVTLGNKTALFRWNKIFGNLTDSIFTYSRHGMAVAGNAWYDIGYSPAIPDKSTIHIYDNVYSDDNYQARGTNLTAQGYQFNDSQSFAVSSLMKTFVMDNVPTIRNNILNGWSFLKGQKDSIFYQYDTDVSSAVGANIIEQNYPDPSQIPYSILYPYVSYKRYAVIFTRPYKNDTIPSVLCDCGSTQEESSWILAGGWLNCIPTNVSNKGFVGYCQKIDPRDPNDPENAGARYQLNGDIVMNWQAMGTEANSTIQMGSNTTFTEY